MCLYKNMARFSLMLLVMFAFAACINDSYVDETEKSSGVGGSHVYSFLFNFEMGDIATRATDEPSAVADNAPESGDLVHGSDAEHAIGIDGNYIFLFHTDGSFYASLDIELSNADMLNSQDHPWHDVEHTYQAQFTADEDELPEEVLCLVVLNGQSIYGQLQAAATNGMQSFLTALWENYSAPKSIGRNNNDLFTLTNASYIDKDGKLIKAVPMNLKEMKQDGYNNLDPSKVVTIHVERMVAKFTFDVNKENCEYDQATDTYIFTPNNHVITYCTFDNDGKPIYTEQNFRIRVTGWEINALETKSYVFKDFRANSNYFTNWSDAANYRTYWAEDTHYTNLTYPWQFRKAVNNADIEYYGINYDAAANTNTNYLTNFNYNYLDNGTFDKTVYVPENTYDAQSLKDKHDNRDHLLAGTHLIVGAVLETDLDNDGKYEAVELWRDRTGVYYKSAQDCFWSLVRQFNYDLQSHLFMNYTRNYWEEGEDYREVSRAALTTSQEYVYDYSKYPNTSKKGNGLHAGADHKLFRQNGNQFTELTYNYIQTLPDDLLFSPAIVEDGDGQVLPWFEGMTIRSEDAAHSELDIFASVVINYDNEGRRRVIGEFLRTADNNDIRSMLYEWLGAVDHFKNGKMYYAAPAELHMNANSTMEKTGIYGVVRNNWYQYHLNDIQTIGTSVDNVDEPIVPNKVFTNDQLNITVNIIDWHSYYIDAPVLD